MPTQLPTRFTSWEFSTQEANSAYTLNEFQYKHIETLRSGIAEQILNLDPSNYKSLEEKEWQIAYLRGQLDVLGHILQVSDSTTLQINTEEHEAQLLSAQQQQSHDPNLFNAFRSMENNSKSQSDSE